MVLFTKQFKLLHNISKDVSFNKYNLKLMIDMKQVGTSAKYTYEIKNVNFMKNTFLALSVCRCWTIEFEINAIVLNLLLLVKEYL